MVDKKVALSVRVPEALKVAIDKAAIADGRSTSSFVIRVLSRWIEANIKPKSAGDPPKAKRP